MRSDNVASLADRVRARDRRAIARALTVVERGDTAARELIRLLFPDTGRAHRVGIVGSGGVGKSTLIFRLASEWRRRGRRVGVVAVDPTSALTGGALLGDRVRMEELHGDPDVFVRSMATRGGPGGLASAAGDALRVLDAARFDLLLLETIGVGQDQVAVADVTETVVVVEAPNMGDDVQALKAGLIEIANVFAVNKADLPGADRVVAHLRAVLALGGTREWTPPLVKTSAASGDGIAELADAVESHLEWLVAEGGDRRNERAAERARREVRRLLVDELLRDVLLRAGDPDLSEAAAAISARGTDPYSAVRELLEKARRQRVEETVRQA